MSNFAEAMQSNPPRLVVLFRWSGAGQEEFHWGLDGGRLNIVGLIGAVVKAQQDLCAEEWMPECDNPEPAFVLAWDAAEGEFRQWLHPDIPRGLLVGMLDVIRSMLVDSRIAQHAAAQRVQSPRILGVDGRPMRM